VRRKKGAIRSRVKSDLPIVFTEEKLSAYGGIELFRRFLDRSGFAERLQHVFSIRRFDGDYGSFRVTLALMGMLLLGGARLRHLRLLEHDPLFLRFARLHRLPTDRTVSNTLKETTSDVRDRLSGLLREVAYDSARSAGLSRITIDLDGTVLRTGLFAEGAERGFNPHHPKDKSYYPLTADLAQTGQLLAVVNRDGNVHDSHRALETLASVVDDVRKNLAPRNLEARFDGAFFRRDILDFLNASGIEYAIKAPLWDWLDTRKIIAQRKRWKRIGPGLQALHDEAADSEVGSHAARGGVPQARLPSDSEELPARSVRSQRRPLRVLLGGHQQARRPAHAVGLHGRPRRPREDARRTETTRGLRHHSDSRLGRELNAAAHQRADP
jgi:hypothetical protein